jgi:hypothetical protein
MPWKASSVMEERLRFVARLLDGEAMTEVCREFGISRKTGFTHSEPIPFCLRSGIVTCRCMLACSPNLIVSQVENQMNSSSVNQLTRKTRRSSGESGNSRSKPFRHSSGGVNRVGSTPIMSRYSCVELKSNQ